jgi:hypothetical protein
MEVKEQRAEVAIDFPRDFRSETDPARLGKKDPGGGVRVRGGGLEARRLPPDPECSGGMDCRQEP